MSVTPEKGKEFNETATPTTSSPTKEQAEARINQEQSPVSAEDTIETNDQQEEILKSIDDSYVQRTYSLESCKYENGDESYDTMLTCDICDGWYHLTCINLTQETAQELSAWIDLSSVQRQRWLSRLFEGQLAAVHWCHSRTET